MKALYKQEVRWLTNYQRVFSLNQVVTKSDLGLGSS